LRQVHAPLDTNIVERALKLVIQVRKSSMFYKTLSGASFASYVQSAGYIPIAIESTGKKF